MRLPAARGPLSESLLAVLVTDPEAHGPHLPVPPDAGAPEPDARAGALDDDDLQLALTLCYELHYRGLDAVDERWEWHPGLLGVRMRLEQRFDAALRATVPAPAGNAAGSTPLDAPIDRQLLALVEADSGPPLASYLRRQATLEQWREFLVHRSIYQLKEADPHSFALPRLSGRAKEALVEIQADEYGRGRPGRMHAQLFAATMRALGLDDDYGHYLDRVGAASLAAVNAVSMFALHRRHRGALLGHLAAFEMTSSIPSRKYGDGLRRLGFDAEATQFFDEHVEADSVHDQLAASDLCGGLVTAEPHLRADVLFGAATCLALEGRAGKHLLAAWEDGHSSLRVPLAPTAPQGSGVSAA